MTDQDPPMSPAEMVASEFHAAYEQIAPAFNYETREASAVPWRDVPLANRWLMIATVGSLIARNIIVVPDVEQPA